MNITNAQYVSETLLDGTTENTTVKATIDGEKMFAPIDPDNRHYQAILKWVAKGNTIQEAD